MKTILPLLAAMLFATAAPAVAQSSGPATAPDPATASAPSMQGAASARMGANPAGAQTETTYTLGPADKVRVIVYGEEALSGEFSVNDSGALSLPLIGSVPAAGRTPDQVVTDIEARLADGYLLHPRVSMDVLTYRPFYILGEVNKPGTYPYSNGLTVMSAVATAEGFTYRASKRKVMIKHSGETDEQSYPLTAGLKIDPGDTIRIGERHF